MSGSKKTVIFYCQRYGSSTLIFLYRQALFVGKHFNTIVFTPNKQKDPSLYPDVPVFVKGISLLNRFKRAFIKLSGHYSWISNPQKKYFENIILNQGDVKLIHAHFGPSAIEILPVAEKLNIPLLVTFHGYDISFLLSNKRYLNDLKRLFKYAYIISITNDKRKVLLDLGALPERIFLNYFGVPLGNFKYINRKSLKDKVAEGLPINFLQVSSLTEKKGHKYTLEAFTEILKQYPKSYLTFGGEGDLKDALITYSKKLGIENNVKFVGKVNITQVIELMNAADVFLHHSITDSDGATEGLPSALMEAMATGLIVISTFHAGIPELIENGVNGLLVAEKDIPGYVKAIQTAMHQDEKIGIRAHDKVNADFNIERQVEKLADIYETIIKTSGKEVSKVNV
jgi:colanic acid/amylovoran biosynthesis glycosyltransferase